MGEHKHAKVLRAIADGKEVEYWSIEAGEWASGGYINPITSYELEWRIKPEPKPPIVVERWICLDDPVGIVIAHSNPYNVRFTFDPDTREPIKVELI